MALRIIRKSSSQSQVELVKGSAEGKPSFSLLAIVESALAFEALKNLLAHEFFQQAEVLIYKAHDYADQIRSQLPALAHTAKLINESKPGSHSLRLRTLIQESATDYGLFLPFVPASDPVPALQAALSALQQDASLGLAAPAFVDAEGQTLLAAGQDVAASLSEHQLVYNGSEQTYKPEDRELFYFYRDLPELIWSQLAPGPLQVSGAALPFAAIRREAYLALTWADQDWNWPWLAQDLAMGLRQKQYRMALVPALQPLGTEEQAVLKAEEMPASFQEKWQTQLRQIVFTLYRHHGWKQAGTCFSAPQGNFDGPPAQAERIRKYLVQKG